MKTKPIKYLLSAVVLLSALSANAQQLSINWFALPGGGGSITGEIHTLSGSIGQPFAANLATNDYTLVGGFWPVVPAVRAATIIYPALDPPGPIQVGDIFTLTCRITAYDGDIEIDGFGFDVIYPSTLFSFVGGSFYLGDASGPNQQWLSKPNQESPAAGYRLVAFNDDSRAGQVRIRMEDGDRTDRERGTIASDGFLVSFQLRALAPGTGRIEILGSDTVLLDTSSRPAFVPDLGAAAMTVLSPLTVSITSPSNGATFFAPPGNFSMDAITPHASGTVSNVQFFVNGASQGLPDATPPYSVTVSNRPPGFYDLQAVVRDTFGLRATSAPVRVVVSSAPDCLEIFCPSNLLVESCREPVAVQYSVWATNRCFPSNISVNCTPPSGSLFPPGLSLVTCSASDGFGASIDCSFTVMVRDTTPPVIGCPSNRVVQCAGPAGTIVDYGVTAVDECAGDVEVSCTPASGSVFPPGATTISCTATDLSGNASHCSFIVTVVDTSTPTFSIVLRGDTAVICWPVTCSNYQLEETSDLNAFISWSPVSASVMISADQNCVTVPLVGGQRFFRLRSH